MDYQLLTEFDPQLETDWNALVARSTANYPFLRYAFQRDWWQTRGGGEWQDASLHLVLAYDGDVLAGIAPLFSATNEGKQSLMLVGSFEVCDYLDVIAQPEQLNIFLTGLFPFIQEHIPGIEVIELYNLQESSPTLTWLTQNQPTATLEVLQPTPYIALAGDWDQYLACIDKKQRHEIKRKMRRAEESDLEVKWYRTVDLAMLDQDTDAFLALMAEGAEKAAFLSDDMKPYMRQVIHTAFDEGYLYLVFLEVSGKKAAAKLFFDYENKLWGYNSGYSRDFLELSPGWVLLSYILQWANENGRSEFDFMRGNEAYKYRFGAVDRHVMKATISI